MAELILMAAWPNGNSGGARTPDRSAGKPCGERQGRTCLYQSPGGVFFVRLVHPLDAALRFRARHETGGIAAVTDPGALVAPRGDNFDRSPFSPRWPRSPMMPADCRIY
jgi:hypothetical protein